MIIETENLKLIPCNTEILKYAIAGNEVLAEKLGITVADNWTEFGVSALQYALDKLLESKEEEEWWTFFPIHKKDNRLIGSGGFNGKPTEDGIVELGYEIMEAYRNQGFATEMAKGLIQKAFANNNVSTIIAHTLGQENPSTSVLTKCGFEKVEAFNDPDEGLLWKWELIREK